MTDPSFAGQLITFTYPHIGNYGVSAAGDGVRARRGRARRSCARRATARTRRAPSAAGWTGSTDCGVPAISGVDTRALVRHIREAGAMRGGVFPASIAAARGARADRGRAADGRPGPRARRHARAKSAATARRRRAADRGDRHRHQGLDGARARRARRARLAAPVHDAPPSELLADDPDAVFLANGPGDPAALGYVVETVRELVGKQARVGHLPRPPAALPRGRPRDLQAALRPPRRQPPGQGPADRARRDHLPEPRLRRARPGRRRARSTPTSRCAGRPTSAPPRSRT